MNERSSCRGHRLKPLLPTILSQEACSHSLLVTSLWSSSTNPKLRKSVAGLIARLLERQGILEGDIERAWLTSSAGGKENRTAIHHLPGSSSTYRNAIGQHGKWLPGRISTSNSLGCSSRPRTVRNILPRMPALGVKQKLWMTVIKYGFPNILICHQD